ncbi:MAG: methyl-accepting chemotaxis protein, partial [Gammaproteobacteria bacterium]|nr:methyl-accepting chemotaxis protein [Gammaproteobacteria bacterium]
MAVTRISAVVRTESGIPVLILSSLAVVFFITMIGAFAYGLIRNRYVTEYQALAHEQQLLSQRIATSALETASGRDGAGGRLQQLKDRFDRVLNTLDNGNATSGLPPVHEDLRPQLSLVQGSWQVARQSIDTILEGEQSVELNRSMVIQVGEMIPQLIAIADEAVTLMVEKRARPEVVYLATRQLMLAQRVGSSLHMMAMGGEGAATAADRFGRDAALFGRVLNGLLKGSSALNVKAIKDPEIVSALNDINGIFVNISDSIGAILESSPQLFAVLEAARRIDEETTAMLDATVGLDSSFAALSSRQDLFFMLALAAGASMIISLAAIGFILVRNARQRLEEQTEQGRRNQRAILRLLDELTNLADGDLTTHATVSEDITGAIADSVNYAIDALRSLVTSINRTTDEVNAAADSSRGNAEQLADASNSQAREIASATSSVNDMADTMERVSKNAAGSADVAMKSVDIAAKGADT